MNIYVKENSIDSNKKLIEIVERKGLGHPDTIADGIAESISIEYSKYCLDNFGAILHHNVDKSIILGGQCELEYGSGKLLKPFRVLFGGRMSRSFNNQDIDLNLIQTTATKEYLQRILPRLHTEQDLVFHHFTSSNSRISHWFTPRTVADLPEYQNPRANDTATIVGYWPFSTVEKIVLESERFFYVLNSQLKSRFDFIGSDIKVMALRQDKDLELTLCVPFQADKVNGRAMYLDYKSFIHNELLKSLINKFGGQLNITLNINTQDQKINEDNDDGKGRYLTVIGSALDYGEEGISGRGNRCRGLISSMRPSAVESIYGKNPVYHIGKVYSYVANILAKKLGSMFGCEATVIITARNSDPLHSPHSILVDLSGSADKKTVQKIIDDQLQEHDWTSQIVANGIFLPPNELIHEQ